MERRFSLHIVNLTIILAIWINRQQPTHNLSTILTYQVNFSSCSKFDWHIQHFCHFQYGERVDDDLRTVARILAAVKRAGASVDKLFPQSALCHDWRDHHNIKISSVFLPCNVRTYISLVWFLVRGAGANQVY